MDVKKININQSEPTYNIIASEISFIGNNNSFVYGTKRYSNVKYKHTYRIYFNQPDRSGVTIAKGTANGLVIGSYKDDKLVTEIMVQSTGYDYPDYYDFSANQDYDYIILGGRCTKGVEVIGDISDITGIIPRISFIGENDEFVHGTERYGKIKYEHTYRIYFNQPDRSGVTIAKGTANGLVIGSYKDDKLVTEITVQSTGYDYPDYYDFFADQDYDYITLGGRCTKGVEAIGDISDITGIDSTDSSNINYFNPKKIWTTRIASASFPKPTDYSLQNTATKPLVLLHFSDIHGSNVVNTKRLLEFHGKYSSYIDNIINTGDSVSNTYADSFGFAEVNGADSILTVIGNHDTADFSNGKYNWTAHAGLDAYNKFIAPFVNNWGVTQPANAATQGYCYYYKDYTNKGIRLICLDVMGYDSTQETWFANTLLSATQKGLAVIVAAHFLGSIIEKIDCRYSAWDKISLTSETYYNPATQSMTTILQSWLDQNSNAEFICWIRGHEHSDFIGKVQSTNQLVITVDTAQSTSSGVDMAASTALHKTGTKSQDCFSIVSFDIIRKIVTVQKVGSNIDFLGNEKNSISIDYKTLNCFE